MSLKDLKNNPSRNGFDLSFRNAFTAKAGQLLPVMCKEVLPGDKFKFGLQSFTRTAELQSCAFTRMKEYYDFFFVPTRLLWRDFDAFITQMPSFKGDSIKGSTQLNIEQQPYISTQDLAGYVSKLYSFTPVSGSASDDVYHFHGKRYDEGGCYRGLSTVALLDMLGYGNYSSFFGNNPNTDFRNVAVSPFPLLGYQKVYSDYYRNDLWENDCPHMYNVDYISGKSSSKIDIHGLYDQVEKFSETLNFLDLRYSNLNQDMIMGVMPSPQYGDAATFGISVKDVFDLEMTEADPAYVGSGVDLRKAVYRDTVTNKALLQQRMSILALRQAEYLQKWKEISQSGRKNYKDQIEKHFGVHISDIRSNRCEFIGGTSRYIDIDEVVNTALMEAENVPTVKGKGVGVIADNQNFEAPEHGFIFCIYHVNPILDYDNNGLDAQLLRVNPTDYAIPEFDKLGMQELPTAVLSLFDQFNNHPLYLGYVPRYIDYKTSLDKVHGEFITDLKTWTTKLEPDLYQLFLMTEKEDKYSYLSKRRHILYKVRPSFLDNIFAMDSKRSDQFRVNCNFDIKAVRSLDRNGLPY